MSVPKSEVALRNVTEMQAPATLQFGLDLSIQQQASKQAVFLITVTGIVSPRGFPLKTDSSL